MLSPSSASPSSQVAVSHLNFLLSPHPSPPHDTLTLCEYQTQEGLCSYNNKLLILVSYVLLLRLVEQKWLDNPSVIGLFCWIVHSLGEGGVYWAPGTYVSGFPNLKASEKRVQ